MSSSWMDPAWGRGCVLAVLSGLDRTNTNQRTGGRPLQPLCGGRQALLKSLGVRSSTGVTPPLVPTGRA